MQRMALLAAVVAAFMSPTASAESFGVWAMRNGYSSGDVMPNRLFTLRGSIDRLDGIGDFDWTTTPTTSLDLGSNQLTSIEPDDFSGLTDLTSLDLGRNRLTSIASSGFNGLSNLMELDLHDNQLTSIESGDFNGLSSLTLLDLNRNQLTSIEPGGFSGLSSLTSLDLHDNQLTNIASGSFNGLSSLTSLDLNRNQLASIEPGGFNGLSSLTSLSLWSNQLTSIEQGDFNGLSNLVSLHLGSNQLTSIERDDFSGLTNLTSLHLQVTSIDPGGFNGLSSLTHLSLTASIAPGDLSELTNLTSLDLSGYPHVESGVFSGMANLKYLTFWFNETTSIESGAFSGLTNLEGLSFGESESLKELNLIGADFSKLMYFGLYEFSPIESATLRNSVLTQDSLLALMRGRGSCLSDIGCLGIGYMRGLTELDLSGIDFANVTDLTPLSLMRNLTDLWLVGTQNMDAVSLDTLLDNLETIEGTDTEGVLYMSQADFDAFNTAGGGLLAAWDAEPGHRVAIVEMGCDLNGDGVCDGTDADLVTQGSRAEITRWLTDAGKLAGDLNIDGTVDSGDLGLLLNNFQSPGEAVYTQGDINNDGVVNSDDLGRLLNSFNRSSPVAVSNVPESVGVFGLCFWTGLARSLRRKRKA